jgi:hypothetical protein
VEEDVPVFPGGEDQPELVHYVLLLSWLASPCLQEPRLKERRMMAGARSGLLPNPKDERSIPAKWQAAYLMRDTGNPAGGYAYFRNMLSFQQHYGMLAILEMQLFFHQLADKINEVDVVALEKPGVGAVLAKQTETLYNIGRQLIETYPRVYSMHFEAGSLLEDLRANFAAGFTTDAGDPVPQDADPDFSNDSFL